MSFHFQILIVEEPSSEPRETKPANLVALKTGASSLRDSINQSEKEEEWRGKGRSNSKSIDKLRRNLAELEAQLVLASPNLLFQVMIIFILRQRNVLSTVILYCTNLFVLSLLVLTISNSAR